MRDVGRMLKRYFVPFPLFLFPFPIPISPFDIPFLLSSSYLHLHLHLTSTYSNQITLLITRKSISYEKESISYINTKVDEWEKARGEDPDETEDEAEVEASALMEQGYGMQGVRVPVV